jgi:hypothetical protein
MNRRAGPRITRGEAAFAAYTQWRCERIYILPTQAPLERPTRIPTAAVDAAFQGGPSARQPTSFEHANRSRFRGATAAAKLTAPSFPAGA